MWPLIALAGVALVLVGVVFLLKALPGNQSDKEQQSPYQKKKYLFDTTSEFTLYKILLELYGERYHVFPQINYSHVVEAKPMDWKEQRRYRSRIDRKSADFVLCDKDRVVPQLIIELDGSAHNIPSKQRRDEFIDDITKIVGLPILHLKTGRMDRETIKTEVDRALTESESVFRCEASVALRGVGCSVQFRPRQ
jgi:very-short-patch-repair endonuclease